MLEQKENEKMMSMKYRKPPTGADLDKFVNDLRELIVSGGMREVVRVNYADDEGDIYRASSIVIHSGTANNSKLGAVLLNRKFSQQPPEPPEPDGDGFVKCVACRRPGASLCEGCETNRDLIRLWKLRANDARARDLLIPLSPEAEAVRQKAFLGHAFSIIPKAFVAAESRPSVKTRVRSRPPASRLSWIAWVVAGGIVGIGLGKWILQVWGL
jgi:hypothetical protein